MNSIRLRLGILLKPFKSPESSSTQFGFPSTLNQGLEFSFEAITCPAFIDVADLRMECKIGVDGIASRPLFAALLEPVDIPVLPSCVNIIDLSLTPPEIIEVENTPIDPDEIRVYGRNYADRIWYRILRSGEKPIHSRSPRVGKLRKSYFEFEPPTAPREKIIPKAPSYWDLIYAVLQPPLIIEQKENLYLPHDLFPFQRKGIEFLLNNETALLADEMGTGKTVQTVVALRLLVEKGLASSALVVCPVSVLRQWVEHLSDWSPDLLITAIHGDPVTRALDWIMPAHVYIVGYDTLRNDVEKGILPVDHLGKFDVVVLDEAQYIKNADNRRSRSVFKLKASWRWGLTGTPVENSIDDVISIFRFLRPRYLTFLDNTPAMIRRKIAPFFLRRLKKDVLKDLPPLIRQEIWLDLNPKQRDAYDTTLREGRDELGRLGEKVNKVEIFTVITKLKQICNFPPDQSDSPKSKQLLEQIETIVENKQKVIVFSQYVREGVEKIEFALNSFGCARIIGGQSDHERTAQINKFLKDGNTPILIASVRAGGVGLNLQAASYVIHFDHWWNPAVMWQAESRAHRQGQKQTVNVYSYWIEDTIEERIFQLLEEKGLLFKDIVDGLSEKDIDDLITTEEWLDILGVSHQKISPTPMISPLEFSIYEIQQRLFSISPSEFEHVVKELFHYIGYPNSRVVGRTADGGIDVISSRNTTGGIVRVVAQCKRYKVSVGVEVARDFMGAIAVNAQIEKGYLVTTGEFTRECMTFCETSGMIIPINGPMVANYIKKFGIKI